MYNFPIYEPPKIEMPTQYMWSDTQFEIIREYVISVCASAILCSVILLLINDGPTQNIIKILCGLYIVIFLLRYEWEHRLLPHFHQRIS